MALCTPCCNGDSKEDSKPAPINRDSYADEIIAKPVAATAPMPPPRKEEPKAQYTPPVSAPPKVEPVSQPEPEQSPPEAPAAPLSFTVLLDPGGSLGVQLQAGEIPELPKQAQGCVIIKGATYEAGNTADGANGPWGSSAAECTPPKLSKNSDGGPAIFPGDAVLEVNGARFARGTDAEAALRAAAQSGGSVRLGVQPRPLSFRAALVRKEGMSDKIGLSVLLDKAIPDRLTVRVVRDMGMVAEWNNANRFTQVCPGDVLLGVNDVSGRAEEMLELLKSPELGARLELHVQTAERK